MSAAAAWRRLAVAVVAVFTLDQATKAIAVSAVDRGKSVNVFFGLDVTNVRNTGVAFGAFTGAGTAIAVVAALALAGLVVYFALNARTRLLWLPAGVILGGAFGNLADRVREGAVIDFIDPAAWPAFNVADAAIVAGVLGLLYVAEGER